MTDTTTQNQIIQLKPISPELSDIKQFYEFESLVIQNQEGYEQAAAKLILIDQRYDRIDEFKKQMLSPAETALNTQKKIFKDLMDPLKSIKAILKGKMARFIDARQAEVDAAAKKKRDEEAAKFRADAEAQKIKSMETGSSVALEASNKLQAHAAKLDAAPTFTRQTVKTAFGTVAHKKIWKFKVTDSALVPREYLIVDEVAVGKLKKEFGEAGKTIPGIEFYQETIIA